MEGKKIELKPCPLCGRKPVIEHWSSGGLMYMVKCNNPDCQIPSCGYPKGHNLNEVKEKGTGGLTMDYQEKSNLKIGVSGAGKNYLKMRGALKIQ